MSKYKETAGKYYINHGECLKGGAVLHIKLIASTAVSTSCVQKSAISTEITYFLFFYSIVF